MRNESLRCEQLKPIGKVIVSDAEVGVFEPLICVLWLRRLFLLWWKIRWSDAVICVLCLREFRLAQVKKRGGP